MANENKSKVPKVITVLSHPSSHLISWVLQYPDLAGGPVPSCPPPCVLTTWDVGAAGDWVHDRTCAAGTSPAWVKNVATYADLKEIYHLICLLFLPGCEARLTKNCRFLQVSMKPGLQRIAGFFRSMVSPVEVKALGAVWLLEISPAFI